MRHKIQGVVFRYVSHPDWAFGQSSFVESKRPGSATAQLFGNRVYQDSGFGTQRFRRDSSC